MKTAISIPDDIFKEIDRFAREHNYKRSEVFVIAVRDFLEKMKSQNLLEALNKAYSDEESSEEKAFRQKSKKRFAAKVLKE